MEPDGIAFRDVALDRDLAAQDAARAHRTQLAPSVTEPGDEAVGAWEAAVPEAFPYVRSQFVHAVLRSKGVAKDLAFGLL